MGMDTSEVLFTRQRHEAKRAGLHYDIRLVHGDLAYSWATKLDMPKPGEAIVLHQQPVHDAHYALSEKVVIPKGQYGAGITTLDFVRKAQLKKSDDGSYFTLTTPTEKYLLKHIPAYGEGQWLFKNLTPYREAEDSTVSSSGKSYKVNDLLDKAKDIQSKKFSVDELKWVLKNSKLDPKRVREANYKFPLLLSRDESGKVIVLDGAHRLKKAIKEGQTEIRGKVLSDLDKPLEKKAILLTLWENRETGEKKWFPDMKQPYGPGWTRTSAKLYKHKKEADKLLPKKEGLVKKADLLQRIIETLESHNEDL